MKVRLLLFAVLREIVGSDERMLTLEEGATAGDVWQALRVEFPALDAYREPPLVAVNESYAGPTTRLQDGDDLAFIPPVAGG
ncbi:MAG TPA: MoaD/ThiS family protein [Thermoanaerobaculia bacterium]